MDNPPDAPACLVCEAELKEEEEEEEEREFRGVDPDWSTPHCGLEPTRIET